MRGGSEESTKYPVKQKRQREASRKMRARKHFQAAFQSIIFSWVLDTSESVCNFAVVIIIVADIIIIRVIPERQVRKADGKG